MNQGLLRHPGLTVRVPSIAGIALVTKARATADVFSDFSQMTDPRPLAVLAEDEAILRIAAADMLEELGFQVIETCTATEALQKLESIEGVRLLYTDVRMPGPRRLRSCACLCRTLAGHPHHYLFGLLPG